MSQIVRVLARFVHKGSGSPVTDRDITVRLYDNDLVTDDFLAEAPLNDKGLGEMMFDLDKAKSPDSITESKPDLYVELYRNNSAIYQSPVDKNVDFTAPDTVSGEKRLTVNMGTFKVDI